MRRPREELADRCGLNNAASVHNQHPIANFGHRGQIVRDEYDRRPELIAHTEQQPENLGPHGHVESGCWFVRQDEVRAENQRRSDQRALLHAAAELVGITARPHLRQR